MIRKDETNPGKTQEEIIIQTMISGLSVSPMGRPDSFFTGDTFGSGRYTFFREDIL
jgi:hypothetical protein